MKNYKLSIGIATLWLMGASSCQTHTCNCYAVGQLTATHTLKGSKKEAKADCTALEGDIPWSETYCRIED